MHVFLDATQKNKRLYFLPTKWKYFAFLSVWGSLLGASCFGQSTKWNDVKLSGNYQYGFALPEYSVTNYLSNQPIQSFAFHLSKETSGKNQWEKLYKFPEYGLSAYYTTLGNDNVMGRALSLNYFFRLNFINKKRFQVYNQTGIGIGYLTKHFDLVENYENVSIGSHVNAHFNLRFGCSVKISKKIDSFFGISLDHFSNANSHDPNLGINLLTGFAGVSYRLKETTIKETSPLDKHQRKRNVEITQSFGGKQTRALSGQFFFTSSLSGGMNFEWFRGFHGGIGADIFFDNSMKTLLEAKNKTFHATDNFQTGIHISQEFVYNRFSLIVQEGFYVGLLNKGLGKTMYNRGIVQYRFSDHFMIRVAMKSHLHILDFPEIGLGIKW